MGRWSGWKIAELLCLSLRNTSTSSDRLMTPCSHLPEKKKRGPQSSQIFWYLQLDTLVPV